MKAVILAAGICSRLRPLTEEMPKGLLSLGNSTCLDRQVAALRERGINDIVMVVGFQADRIREHFKDRSITFIENPEYESTNSAYSFWLTREHILDDDEGFLVFNSDLIFRPDMLDLLLGADVGDAIIVDPDTLDPESDMVKVELDREGRMLDLSKQLEMERAHAEAVGPVKFSKEGGERIVALLEKRINDSARNEWFFYSLREYLQAHPFHAVHNNAIPWAEIDTEEDLEKALKDINEGRL